MTTLRLLPLLLFVACATHSAIEASREQVALGQFARAFVILDQVRSQQLKGGGEVDADLEAEHAKVRKLYLLHRAEELIFEEDEEEALATLVELDNLEPGYPGIAPLRSRAVAKKAQRIVARGEEHLVRKEFVQAMASFLESQTLIATVVGHPLTVEKVQKGAAEGIKAVGSALGELSSRGQQQFLEAVRKLPEFRYVEVQWHANNVIHNTPEREEAKTIEAKARRENALKSIARGKACELRGRFGAALLEYRAAKEIDKDVPEVDALIAAMEREQKAALLIEEAQKQMRLSAFDEARAVLAQAFELSVMARNEIGAMVTQTRRMEAQQRFQAGLDFEVLGRKQEALAAFEALAKDWPEGFRDEKAHIVGLKVDIEGAATEWAAAEAAEAAGDLPKALDHYLNSVQFYAGWKDGKERIARLRDAIKPPSGGGSGGSQGG